jgi:hypothetical protein
MAGVARTCAVARIVKRISVSQCLILVVLHFSAFMSFYIICFILFLCFIHVLPCFKEWQSKGVSYRFCRDEIETWFAKILTILSERRKLVDLYTLLPSLSSTLLLYSAWRSSYRGTLATSQPSNSVSLGATDCHASAVMFEWKKQVQAENHHRGRLHFL